MEITLTSRPLLSMAVPSTGHDVTEPHVMPLRNYARVGSSAECQAPEGGPSTVLCRITERVRRSRRQRHIALRKLGRTGVLQGVSYFRRVWEADGCTRRICCRPRTPLLSAEGLGASVPSQKKTSEAGPSSGWVSSSQSSPVLEPRAGVERARQGWVATALPVSATLLSVSSMAAATASSTPEWSENQLSHVSKVWWMPPVTGSASRS
jgi:hypothetical protein